MKFPILIVILLAAIIGSLFVGSVSPRVYAQEDYGLEEAAKEAKLPSETRIPVIVGRVVRVIFGILGLILVVIIITGGFTWMTSAGNPEKVKKAKGLITNGIIGLAIVVFAYVIANFIIQRLTAAAK